MVWLIIEQWNQLQAFHWQFNPWLLSIAILGIVVLFFLDAYGWHLVLKAMGQDITASQSIFIWFLSSLTRYLPGGFWPYISRASLAKDQGLDIMTSSISVYLETLLLISSALAVGFPSLLYAADIHISPLSALLILIVFGLLMHPKIIQLVRYFPCQTKNAINAVQLPSLPVIAALYIYYVFFWLFFGIIFYSFVYSVYPVPFQHIIPVGSAIAFAFFSGLIVVFIPAGIGIREATLYLLLISFLPHTTCLVISISSRLWVMLGEGLSICLVFIWRRLIVKPKLSDSIHQKRL